MQLASFVNTGFKGVQGLQKNSCFLAKKIFIASVPTLILFLPDGEIYLESLESAHATCSCNLIEYGQGRQPVGL